MVSVLASNVVNRGFEPRSMQTTDYEIGICCFSAKYAALRRKSKDWLDMSISGLLCQYPTKRVGLVQTGHHNHLIENLLPVDLVMI